MSFDVGVAGTSAGIVKTTPLVINGCQLNVSAEHIVDVTEMMRERMSSFMTSYALPSTHTWQRLVDNCFALGSTCSTNSKKFDRYSNSEA
jgi:hypothetical protein